MLTEGRTVTARRRHGDGDRRPTGHAGRRLAGAAWAGALFLATGMGGAGAAELYDNGDLQIRWDNTLKYSFGLRVEAPDNSLVNNPTNAHAMNGDDGDRAFSQGAPIFNRVDVLSELDASKGDYGLRISGALWYDTVYNQRNDNSSNATFNAVSTGVDGFTGDTRGAEGHGGDLLDAFVYGKGRIAGMPISVRVGRHTLLWGESLFLAGNGIAYGQAPIDAAKAVGVPDTQAKELFLPVGQISAQVQPDPNWTVEAYFQPEWRRSRLPAAGSYFSDADFIDDGGERIIVPGYAPGAFPGNSLYFLRGADITPHKPDQVGLAVRYHSDALDSDFGLYALNYHDKVGQIYAHQNLALLVPPAGLLGDYQLVFPEDIQLYGVSGSTDIGSWNVAGEISYRHNTPVISGDKGIIMTDASYADNGSSHLYATGNSLHGQVSAIKILDRSTLWDGGQIIAEVGGHRLLQVISNPSAVDPNRDKYAIGGRAVFEPAYYEVLPATTIKIPVGFGYTVGRSPIDIKFNNGAPNHGGDLSVGVKFEYANTWFGGLNYTHFFGAPGDQTLTDRDFVSFNIQRTF